MFIPKILASLACVSLVAVATSAQAVLLTATFTPGTDQSARVAADPNNQNNNCCGVSDGNLNTGRSGTNTWSFRSVLRFDDLATFDLDTEIVGATLRLSRSSAPEANDGQQRLFRLESPFTTSGLDPSCCDGVDANRDLWRLADGLAGTLVGTPFATFIAGAGYNELDVTSIVLDWQANGWTNAHGFGLVGVENQNQSGVTYAGAFSPSPPELVLTFVQPPIIPEPSTLLLAGAGTLLLARVRRRRRR